MLNRKLFASLMVLMLICGMVLTGCSGGTTAQQSTEGVKPSILDKVVDAKKVRVGFLADYAPWGMRNAEGKYEGYDVDVAAKLGEALGVEVELIPVEAPNRLPMLVTGKVDVIIGSFTPTDERAKTIDFSLPYASSVTMPMVWADDSSLKTEANLAGKKVAVCRGTTNDISTGKFIPDAELVRFDNLADVLEALKTKKVDALVEDSPFVYYQCKEDPRFRPLGEGFAPPILLAFGVPKGDQIWLNYLNNFLTNLRFSGELASFYEKWFGFEMPELTLK